MSSAQIRTIRLLFAASSIALLLGACGGNSDNGNSAPATVSAVPAPPADPGFVDNAPVQVSLAAFVDNAATNQRGDARYATMATNAGVRVLNGFRTLWQPLTDIVDAGVSAPSCVRAKRWA